MSSLKRRDVTLKDDGSGIRSSIRADALSEAHTLASSNVIIREPVI